MLTLEMLKEELNVLYLMSRALIERRMALIKYLEGCINLTDTMIISTADELKENANMIHKLETDKVVAGLRIELFISKQK